VLITALGLTSQVTAGDSVLLTPAGLVPIEGVAGCAGTNPDYLDVRTGDALHRCHGRSAIGMSIAAGHHMFAEDVDAEQSRGAWRSRLAQVFA
jgi:hypothetical protein